eukprot:2041319-Amphidinium_carterae.1
MRQSLAGALVSLVLSVAQVCAVLHWGQDGRAFRPPARYMSAAAWHDEDEAVYLVSGVDTWFSTAIGTSPYRFFADTWRYTPAEGWSMRGGFPSPRATRSLVCVTQACYAFGGIHFSFFFFPFGETVTYYADVWMLSTANDTWTQIQEDTSDFNGPPREEGGNHTYHAAVAVDSHVYLHR